MILTAAFALVMTETPEPKLSLLFPTKPIRVKAPFEVVLKATFPEDFHAYQNPPGREFDIPVTVSADPKSAIRIVKVMYPKGTPMKDSSSDKPAQVYSGTVSFRILATVSKSGSTPLRVKFDYQECDVKSCYPPKSIFANGSINVLKAVGKHKP